ncbi:MAG: hypothetical protein GY821_13785 [Gammaproteobacteria bacterium]|nr:hypothetical protein [Gammaproteobacteria bacterium]
MDTLHKLDINRWDPQVAQPIQDASVNALESGQILFLPNLPFELNKGECALLTNEILKTGNKNISFNGYQLSGNQCNEDLEVKLQRMMMRFSQAARELIENLLPNYQQHLTMARTSFRPAEIEARQSSYRKDDTRLHVDAFPATPAHGQRILRLFCNVHPEGEPRVWRVGEPFDKVLQRFLPEAKRYSSTRASLLRLLRITKSKRSLYDHYMNELHNLMKADDDYQKTATQDEKQLPAQSSWIVFTDQVSHAAMRGQYLLEQSFYLPIEALVHKERSPYCMLQQALASDLA